MAMPPAGQGGAPAAPPVTELNLTDDIKTAVNGALNDGTPVVVSYVDPDGQPSLSFRGSTHVYSPTQLAIWVRNPEGGLGKALAKNAKITLLYRNPQTRAMLQFRGSAHVDNAPEIREKVYGGAPEREQAADPDKKGFPLIIDLTRVDGALPPARFAMKR
jgi:hypothetical protein